MRYRVAFEKRIRSDGQESGLDPTEALDGELSDGVVAEKVFVERLEPEAQHSQEVLDEDDAFLALAATEVWEYDVVDSRVPEFEDAVRNSRTVFDISVIEEDGTEPEDAGSISLDREDPFLREPAEQADVPTAAGSGVSATPGDGPAGQPTADPSAGGQPPHRAHVLTNDVEGVEIAGGGGLDELSVRNEQDPSLGLTHPREAGGDWAADTGPAQEWLRGVETRDIGDRSSTLRQPPAKETAPVKRRRSAPKRKTS